jgi:hypothetical protein
MTRVRIETLLGSFVALGDMTKEKAPPGMDEQKPLLGRRDARLENSCRQPSLARVFSKADFKTIDVFGCRPWAHDAGGDLDLAADYIDRLEKDKGNEATGLGVALSSGTRSGSDRNSRVLDGATRED